MILNPGDEINKKWTRHTSPWAQKLTSASGSCKHLQHWKPYHLRAFLGKPLLFTIYVTWLTQGETLLNIQGAMAACIRP